MRAVPAVLPQRIPRRRPDATPGAPTPRERHLHVVDTDARRRDRRRAWLVRAWAIGIIVASLLGVMVHAFMAQAQMRLGRLDTRIDTEVRRFEEARVAVALAQSPDVIITKAREAGLVPAPVSRSIPVTTTEPNGESSAPPAAPSAWGTVKPLLEGPR